LGNRSIERQNQGVRRCFLTAGQISQLQDIIHLQLCGAMSRYVPKVSLFAFLLSGLLLLDLNPANAQMPGGQASAGKQMPKMGKFYGKVIDAKTGKPVDVASVMLMQKKNGKETLIKGTNTEQDGEFMLDELPMMGQFELVISAMGYQEYRKPVAFDMNALMKAGGAARSSGSTDATGIPDNASSMLDAINKDLGNIHLTPSPQTLEGVTVKASQPQYRLEGEKRIFNVDQNLVSQGGTASDVMKNVPGVMVDVDNKVTIRNASPQLLVDGKPSPLTLDQIPADAIESVEVITNPSAKYDAEGGSGGVLNIVLKKNRKKGYNGNVRAGVDSRGGGNAGGDFNFRSGKFNVSSNVNANFSHNLIETNTTRLDRYQDPERYTDQDGQNKSDGSFFFGRLGLDYFITNRTTLSVGGMRMHGEFHPSEQLDITSDTLHTSGTQTGWATRNTTGANTMDRYNLSFDIKHLFPKQGEEWTFNATMNSGRNTNESDFQTLYYNDPSRSTVTTSNLQRTSGSGRNAFYVLQSDYTHPFANKSKFDVGVKATIRNTESYIYNFFDSSGNMVELPNPNSDYKNTDQVYAAYASYSGNFDANNSIQVGLRAESSFYDGTLIKKDSSFQINYPVSLFPSVFYTRKMAHDQQLQFSYRRGINRPNFFQLLPFTDYSDPLNIRQGNPALRPEFTNSFELNYQKNFTRSNYIIISGYERHTENLITSYTSPGFNPFTGETALITSYINAESSDRYGAEVTASWDITKWWNATANLNLYNATLNNDLNTTLDPSFFSGFGKLNNQFRYKKWSGQLSVLYQSRTNLLPDNQTGGGYRGGGPFGPQSSSASQGYLDAYWTMDASIRRSFLKNDAASISLSMNDIFASRYFIQHSENEYFVQDYSRIMNPQMLRLNFNWRFGKLDTDLFRRKNMKGMMEGMQDTGM
jgi:outer membrane receptor protein involved in Fe transport